MWFNPAELSENKTVPLANSANSANYEPETHKEPLPISKLAELADTLPEKTAVESRKVAEVAAAFIPETIVPISKLAELAAAVNQKFVNCGECLYFKCHNSHGKGAGFCTIGGDYGLWSETLHQCSKFAAGLNQTVRQDSVTFEDSEVI